MGQRMRRVRKAKILQGLRNEKMTKFVIYIRHGRRVMRQQNQPQKQRQHSQRDHAENRQARQSGNKRCEPVPVTDRHYHQKCSQCK
jgi:hypothetical protein